MIINKSNNQRDLSLQVPAKGHQLIELGQGLPGINNLCRHHHPSLQIGGHSCAVHGARDTMPSLAVA